MATKAVTKAETPNLPELYQPPAALDIGHEDVALPKVKLGQFMNEHVKQQLVPPGCIFSSYSKEDPDPVVLWTPESKNGVLFHVLALRKGYSISVNGELETWDYDDPDVPSDAWITYTFTIALPEFETDVPYSLLLTRTSKPAAVALCTTLARNVAKGPQYQMAFRLTAVQRENPKANSTYFVARVAQVESTPEGIATASELALAMSGSHAEVKATGTEPAI